jgi:hypothetical protein
MKFSRLSAISCCVAFFALGGGALAADCTGVISQEDALKAEDARYKAQTTGDVTAMQRLFADDLVYSHSSGQVDDKAGYIGKQSSGALQYKEMRRSNVRVRTFGCLAIITGTGSFDAAVGGKLSTFDLVFHSIWVKRGSGVEFVSFQSTPSPSKQ